MGPVRAYAKLKNRPKTEVMEGLERQATARMGDFNAREVASTIWAYATIQISYGKMRSREEFEVLERQATVFVASLCSKALFYLQEQSSFLPEHFEEMHTFLLWREMQLASLPEIDSLDIQSVPFNQRFYLEGG